jgi:hypothetical protein
MWKNIASMEWNAEKDDNQDSFSQDQSALPWAEQPCTTLCGDSTINPSRPIDMGHVRMLLAVRFVLEGHCR